jgi:Na+/H+ antiporter NhaC
MSLLMVVLLLFSFGLDASSKKWLSLWPSLAALIVIFATKKTLPGLLLGSVIGVCMLSSSLLNFFEVFFVDHLFLLVSNRWNISVILFTFLLGAFAELLEQGGGFNALINRVVKRPNKAPRSMQWCAFGLGLICFFDGLANSMLVGKALAGSAEKHGVPREKMAYIVDSTSSSVACVALLSTWIVYQLAMIQEGFALAHMEMEVSAFALFIHSIPYNFYCWFTLILLALTLLTQWQVGPMRSAKASALEHLENTGMSQLTESSFLTVLVPILVLILSLFVGLYVSGAERLQWPTSVEQLSLAIGAANVARVLVLASILAVLTAWWMNHKAIRQQQENPFRVIGSGMKKMSGPIAILLSAWLLSGVLKSLEAQLVLAEFLSQKIDIAWFPALVFITGAILSFSTGTSWGTMGLLMPLAIPIVFAFGDGISADYIAPVIGAVFSGAVFGDHCSPFSDTTIVASLSCGVEPFEHVKTQLPYALLAAGMALLSGFIPTGYGIHPGALLLLGTGGFVLLIRFHKKGVR